MNAPDETDFDFADVMERARMEAWRKVSPSSNLHSTACGADCYNPAHYPEGDPPEGDDDPTQMLRKFLEGPR